MTEPIHPSDAPSDELMALSEALDGSATAEQLALIDASPELGRQLAELGVARAEMIDVDVPATAREAGVAAALAAFDRMHSPADVAVAPSTVVAFGRRRTWYRGVMAAAAAAIVVVAGVATFANLGGDSDDDATSAEIDGSQKTSATDADTMAAAATAAPMADGADDAATETEAPAERIDAAGGATETTAATSADATTVETIGEIPGPAIIDLADEDELRKWAATTDVREGPSPCGDDDAEQVGTVSYQGRSVVVTRAPDSGELFVYDLDGCSLVTTLAP
ncbi:MAG: hypothetical protein AB7U39_22670 [Ilumatobacteraceae bacterium]